MIKNKIKTIIKETITKYRLIDRGDAVVVGISGGPDSVCLFDVLSNLAEELDLTLYPVHINHGFRPGAAEEDQAYAEKFCSDRGFPCKSHKIDCSAMAKELGMTSEEAGRKARYDAFRERCRELADGGIPHEKIKIAVAHNANDQAETIIFRILRGTGTDGLAGIEYKRMEGDFAVVRPLLDVWRRDIEEYCADKNLNPARDHTNEEALYARNKIRLELLPYLEKEYNSNIMAGLVRLGEIAAADKSYLWQSAEESMEKIRMGGSEKEVILNREEMAKLHDAVRHRIIMKAFREIGLIGDVTAERLAAADKIIMKKQGPKTVEFPRGHKITVAKGKVHIGRC